MSDTTQKMQKLRMTGNNEIVPNENMIILPKVVRHIDVELSL